MTEKVVPSQEEKRYLFPIINLSPEEPIEQAYIDLLLKQSFLNRAQELGKPSVQALEMIFQENSETGKSPWQEWYEEGYNIPQELPEKEKATEKGEIKLDTDNLETSFNDVTHLLGFSNLTEIGSLPSFKNQKTPERWKKLLKVFKSLEPKGLETEELKLKKERYWQTVVFFHLETLVVNALKRYGRTLLIAFDTDRRPIIQAEFSDKTDKEWAELFWNDKVKKLRLTQGYFERIRTITDEYAKRIFANDSYTARNARYCWLTLYCLNPDVSNDRVNESKYKILQHLYEGNIMRARRIIAEDIAPRKDGEAIPAWICRGLGITPYKVREKSNESESITTDTTDTKYTKTYRTAEHITGEIETGLTAHPGVEQITIDNIEFSKTDVIFRETRFLNYHPDFSRVRVVTLAEFYSMIANDKF